MINIVWLRRDLQLEDNASLVRALAEDAPVQVVFVFDSGILKRFPNKQDRRLSFIAAALVKLNNELAAKGGGLLVLYGDPKELIPELAAKYKGKVFAGEDYEPGTIARDKYVGARADLVLSKQHVLLAGNEVLKGDGTAYKVFTPYSKAWRLRLNGSDIAEYKISDKGRYAPFSVQLNAAGLLAGIGYECVEDKIWRPEDAHKVLLNFVARRLGDYNVKRNFPAIKGTSAISPYLRFGLVTIRQCYNAGAQSAKWVSELIWRDFYSMILFHYPETVDSEFQPQYRGLKWSHDKALFEAWKQGKTGYPIIDAGMRQLLETGWMHNRVRMLVASFLTKDFGIDWRWGEEHFAQYLMDYDQASNVGGWQWAASTGTDAAPYFRVFNPTIQSKKFDAEGEYIRKYVPELELLSNKQIHEPDLANYPAPIVNHKDVRPRVMSFFKGGA